MELKEFPDDQALPNNLASRSGASAESKGHLINDLYITAEVSEFTISTRIAILNIIIYHGDICCVSKI